MLANMEGVQDKLAKILVTHIYHLQNQPAQNFQVTISAQLFQCWKDQKL